MGVSNQRICLVPTMTTPAKLHRIVQDNNKTYTELTSLPISGKWSNPSILSTPYRLPAPGELVELEGLRSRPELNGVRGKILCADTDAAGRVVVRLGSEERLG